MRHSLVLSAMMLVSTFAFAQADSIKIEDEFARLSGEWDGYFEFATSEDGKSTASIQAYCESSMKGQKWQYEVQYKEGEGEDQVITGGKGNATVPADQKTLVYNGLTWNVVELKSKGDTTTIILEVLGKEKRKVITTRQTIVISDTSFQIVETSKSDTDPSFIFRTRHSFKRRKG